MAVFYEPGIYQVKVMDQTMTTTKKAGHPMLVLQVRVLKWLDDESWMDCAQCYDRTIWLPVDPSDDRSQDRMAKKLRRAGWTGDNFQKLNMIGTTCEAECKAGDWNGQPAEDWDLILPGAGLVAADPAVAKSLNSIMRKRMKAEPSPELDAETVAEQANVAVPDGDGFEMEDDEASDDVPF